MIPLIEGETSESEWGCNKKNNMNLSSSKLIKQEEFIFLALNQALYLFENNKNYLAITELHLNSADDREIFLLAKNYLPESVNFSFPDNFDRELALKIISRIKPEFLIQEGKALLGVLIQTQKALGFVVENKTQEIFGIYGIDEIEKNLCARILIDLRGNKIKKSKVALHMVKFWDEIYSRILFENNFKYITATAMSETNASLMRKITQLAEKKNNQGGFYPTGTGDARYYNNKIIKETWYCCDLEEKFKN